MKNTTKLYLVNAFKSLIKNDAAVESARTTPSYVPIIVSILAVFLPVIPLMVSTANTYGSQFLKAQTYNLDRYHTDALLSLKEQGYEFEIKGGELLRFKENTLDPAPFDVDKEPMEEYLVTVGESTEIKYQFFYSDRTNSGENKIKTLVNDINNTTYLSGTTYVKDSDEAKATIENRQASMEDSKEYKPTYYRPTFFVLYKNGLYINLTKEGKTDRITTVAGDWKHTEEGTKLLERLLSVEGYELGRVIEEKVNGEYKALRDLDYVAGVQKNMNKLYDESYLTAKRNNFLMYTFVFYGIYLVLVLFMGLMMFLLTRGKKNPMNYMTFWFCLKIAMWTTISPAILALILGFMLTNFATMFFIILYGIRVMWLSMRQLRPAY